MYLSRGEDEAAVNVSLSAVSREIFGRKLILIGFFLIGIVLALVVVKTTTPLYEASIVFVATNDTGDQRAAATGGVASLIGLGLKENSVSSFDQYRYILRSDLVAEKLAKTSWVLPTLYADQYDASMGGWRRPTNALTPIKDAVKSFLGLPQWAPPGAEEVRNFLLANLKISLDDTGEIYRATIRYKDKDFAVRLLLALHEQANSQVRSASLVRSEELIDYLRHRLDSEINNETRIYLISLMQEQIKYNAIANAHADYAARLVQPAVASTNPVWPKPLVLIAVLGVLSFLLGVCLVLLRAAWRGQLKDGA